MIDFFVRMTFHTEGSDRGWIVAHVLEMGIALHSVIIGMALGASSDVKDVEALIIALSFHQVRRCCSFTYQCNFRFLKALL